MPHLFHRTISAPSTILADLCSWCVDGGTARDALEAVGDSGTSDMLKIESTVCILCIPYPGAYVQ